MTDIDPEQKRATQQRTAYTLIRAWMRSFGVGFVARLFSQAYTDHRTAKAEDTRDEDV